MKRTGERVLTAAGGFNPTWQRHVAAYSLADGFLPPGRLLDLGCGIMRVLPFDEGEFSSVLSVQSLEHVPDPERVLAEVARVLDPAGTAMFVTPNRLTLGRPDEIIDPYHFREFDHAELAELCEQHFGRVRILGLFGSPRYMEIVNEERAKLERLLAKDPLRLRRFVPIRTKQWLYDAVLLRNREKPDARAEAIEVDDFELRDTDLLEALDVCAICERTEA
jgi:SAM-dependent methyltransferase